MSSENYVVQVPAAADNGTTYGNDIIDLFKFGIGAYYTNQSQQFESKTRYDALNGQLYQNGVAATSLLPNGNGINNYLPLIIGGAILLVAVLAFKG